MDKDVALVLADLVKRLSNVGDIHIALEELVALVYRNPYVDLRTKKYRGSFTSLRVHTPTLLNVMYNTLGSLESLTLSKKDLKSFLAANPYMLPPYMVAYFLSQDNSGQIKFNSVSVTGKRVKIVETDPWCTPLGYEECVLLVPPDY